MTTHDQVQKIMADAQVGATRICGCGSCLSAIKRAEEIIIDMIDDKNCPLFIEHVAMAAAGYAQQFANETRADKPVFYRIGQFASTTATLLREEFIEEAKKRMAE